MTWSATMPTSLAEAGGRAAEPLERLAAMDCSDEALVAPAVDYYQAAGPAEALLGVAAELADGAGEVGAEIAQRAHREQPRRLRLPARYGVADVAGHPMPRLTPEAHGITIK
jgi:hypothetical protein